MEFEKLVSSLDAEGLAQAAEALLRALSGEGAAGKIPSLPDPAPVREARTGGSFPLSADKAAGQLPGAEGEGRGALAAEALSFSPAAVPGGAAEEEGSARIVKGRAALSGEKTAERAGERPDTVPARSRRLPGPETAVELTRIEERLAAVSEQNRRTLGAGAETAPAYLSLDGPAAAGGDTAGSRQFSAFSAPRSGSGGFGAAAGMWETDPQIMAAGGGAAERSFLDAEAVSEFFRRDSRRYDSGFSD